MVSRINSSLMLAKFAELAGLSLCEHSFQLLLIFYLPSRPSRMGMTIATYWGIPSLRCSRGPAIELIRASSTSAQF
jgi:hypothetical protein